MPSVSVCFSTRRIRPFAASARSSPAKTTSSAVGAECTTTTSGRSALRSIPITGVMPLPAVTNRTFAGAGVGSTKSPVGWSSCTTVPGVVRRTRWLLTTPSGIALTVTVMQPSVRCSGEVSEYARHCRTPSTSTPSRTYWPGTWVAPAAARPDDQRDGVAGLGVDGDDAAAQVARERSGSTRSR